MRLYTYRYTVTTRMTGIKMGSDESHFIVSLIVRDKVTRPCPQTTTFLKRKESRSGIGPRPLPLTSLPPYRWAKPDLGDNSALNELTGQTAKLVILFHGVCLPDSDEVMLTIKRATVTADQLVTSRRALRGGGITNSYYADFNSYSPGPSGFRLDRADMSRETTPACRNRNNGRAAEACADSWVPPDFVPFRAVQQAETSAELSVTV